MSSRTPSHLSENTPIERIFKRVMGREMTAQERVYLHLNPKPEPSTRSGPQRHSRAA